MAFTGWEIAGAVGSAAVGAATLWPRIARILARAGIRTPSSAAAIYEENNKALREQNDLLRLEVADVNRKLDTARTLAQSQQKQIDGQQKQISQLSDMVQGVKAIAALSKQVDKAHAEVMSKLDESTGVLAGLITGRSRP